MGPSRIQIVTPAPRGSRKGNRVTALRWAAVLRSLGHRVRLRTELDEAACDVLIVLHAVHGAPALREWIRRGAPGHLVVALSGTDIYSEQVTMDEQVFEHAARIVALQPLAIERLPARMRFRARTILQSAPRVHAPAPREDVFEVVSVAHLRPVKDPLLLARAVRLLPTESRVQAVLVGAALDAELAARARVEARSNPRWAWTGELGRAAVLERIARARLFVQSSLAEGGANSLSEALANGCAVLATRIAGNVGVLGDEHPGLFPVGDERALAELLTRAETEAPFLEELRMASVRLAPEFEFEREREGWRALLAEL